MSVETAGSEHAAPAPSRAAPVMSERRVAIIGGLLVAIGPFSMSLYTPAMPEIVQAFGTTEAAVRISLTLYFAGFAAAQLICGPLSDGLGRRPVTIGFMLLYTAASVMALFANDVNTLIVARFLQGVGAAVGVAMSRAIVRDLFTHEQSARILNVIAMVLAIGPATAPTIGGLTMELFGWHAIFMVMAAAGLGVVALALFSIRETVERDLSRIKPGALATSYGQLLRHPRFITATLAYGSAAAIIYAAATVLPFILIKRIGLTPTGFGLAMLIQSMSYLSGSLVLRFLMPRLGAFRVAQVGAIIIALGAVLMVASTTLLPPSVPAIMVPLGICVFGLAFITPAATTAAMHPFPRQAGAASAMLGFIQMGLGLLAGSLMTVMGDPLHSFAIVIPCLALVSVVCWVLWKRLDRRSDHPLAHGA